MRLFIISILILYSLPVSAQKKDTLIRYFNVELEPCRKKEAAYVGILIKQDNGWNSVVFDSAMRPIMRGNYLDTEAGIKNGYFSYYTSNGKRYLGGEYIQNKKSGLWQTWYPSGNPKDSVFFVNDLASGPCSIHFENGNPEGTGQYEAGKVFGNWIWYHENGKPAAYETWKDGLLEDISCFDSLGNAQGMNCAVSRLPTIKGIYGGFEKFALDSLRFPETAAKYGLEGDVIVSFVVRKSGAIDELRILKSSDESFSKEVIRMIQSIPGWYPAVSHNRNFDQRLTYRIPFPTAGILLIEEPEIL